MQSRRASARIPYDEAVCLTRVDGLGRLYGRGMDLGTGGMALVCTDACPIGTEVRCDLLLPGGPRAVAGQVVRVSAAAAGYELAIAFVDLKPGVVALIEDLVAVRTKQTLPAKLQIDGVDTPLRCEANVDDQTLRLTATLPFLQLDRGVNVVLGTEEAVAASGTIRKIAVDPSSGDGVPRLALDVDLGSPPREQTQPYGATRLTPTQPMKPVPTSLPPAFGKPLPTVVVAPEIAAPEDQPTPAPMVAPPPPPRPAPKPRAARPKATSAAAPARAAVAPARGAAAPLRGTDVVARRNEQAAWNWQPPAVLLVTPAAAVPPPRRPSLLDAPLSARSLMVLAPLLAAVVALVVQLSR
ncbi:MAG TPA: PilZ domain-containing protein [Polyangia bacterium]|nr:PilZ domain-containing protein [Polyangia bacterium]